MPDDHYWCEPSLHANEGGRVPATWLLKGQPIGGVRKAFACCDDHTLEALTAMAGDPDHPMRMCSIRRIR